MDELRELMQLVTEQGFTDFEFENENIRVRLSKAASYPPIPHGSGRDLQFRRSRIRACRVQPETPAPAADPDAGLHKITSPIVGTFYRSPGPDKDAYVKEGSKVIRNPSSASLKR